MLMTKLTLAGLATLLAIAMLVPARAQNQSVTVFAAASLKTALDDIAAEWRKKTGKTARILPRGPPVVDARATEAHVVSNDGDP